MKHLNLDNILPITAIVTFKGKEHEIKPVSLEIFLQNVRDLKKASGDQGDIEKEIELAIRFICRVVPSISEEDVRSLNFDQITAFRNFIEQLQSGDTKVDDTAGNDEGNVSASK